LLRVVANRRQLTHLTLEQQSRVPGKEPGHPVGGRVGAMGGSERIVDVDVGETGERGRQLRVVLRLTGLEAAVLEHQHLARPQSAGERFDLRPDDRGRRGHRLPQELAETGGHGRHRQVRIGRAIRAAQVGDQDRACPALAQQLDRRQRGADPGVVGDLAAPLAVAQRNVEVHACEHACPLQRGVADARLGEPAALVQAAAGSRSSTFAATSTQRFE
jgi:hypothetical protein